MLKIVAALILMLALSGVEGAAGIRLGDPEPAPRAADWPQWRGPERQGWSPETGIPDAFPPDGLKLLWKSEKFAVDDYKDSHHRQGGSPVVALGRIYCQALPAVKGGQQHHEELVCFDLKDGKRIWQYTLSREPGYPTANGTPLVDVAAKRIYATPSSGDQGTAKQTFMVHCVDAETGRKIWSVDAPSIGLSKNALGCASPLLADNLLIIVGAEKVVALSKIDGKPVWTWPEKLTAAPQDRPGTVGKGGVKAFEEAFAKLDQKAVENVLSTSSPILVKAADRSVVLVQVHRIADCCYGTSTVALDLKTGKDLWMGGMTGSHCSPVFADGLLLTLAYDFSQGAHYSHPLCMVVLKPQTTKGGLTFTEVWRTPPSEGGNRYKMVSPVVVNSRAYWTDNSSLYCGDLASGKVFWKAKADQTGWPVPSPVWADGKIFFLMDSGLLTVVKDEGRAGKTLFTQKVCGHVGATPTLADGRLLVRDHEWGLLCYELKPQATSKRKTVETRP